MTNSIEKKDLTLPLRNLTRHIRIFGSARDYGDKVVVLLRYANELADALEKYLFDPAKPDLRIPTKGKTYLYTDKNGKKLLKKVTGVDFRDYHFSTTCDHHSGDSATYFWIDEFEENFEELSDSQDKKMEEERPVSTNNPQIEKAKGELREILELINSPEKSPELQTAHEKIITALKKASQNLLNTIDKSNIPEKDGCGYQEFLTSEDGVLQTQEKWQQNKIEELEDNRVIPSLSKYSSNRV